jgi:hypothetical protein
MGGPLAETPGVVRIVDKEDVEARRVERLDGGDGHFYTLSLSPITFSC